jgi:quinol monooxygenase YgiN
MSNEQQGATRREFVAATAGAAAVAAFGFNRLTHAEDTAGVITQLVTLTMKAGAEDKAIEALKKLTDAVKEKEPGVLCYTANRSQKDPSKIVFYEVYKDEAAKTAHGTQPHLREMFAMSRELFDGPMDLQPMDRVGGFTRES